MSEKTFSGIDAGRAIDWGRTSADYDRFRPGPPDSFYAKLEALDLGLPGQRVLDLGTGTGLLARRFAAQGADVAAVDISADQLAAGQAAARRDGVQVAFAQAPAEVLPFRDGCFDVVTANQCWIYFDLQLLLPELLRVMAPDARLLVSHFSFIPHLDATVRASEALVLEHNPDWTGAGFDGVIKAPARWSLDRFDLVGLFVYDEQIPFSRESWRGRMRALRGIAASLTEAEVDAFDQAHDRLLAELAGDRFSIWHRIHAHIYRCRSQAPYR